MKLFFIVLLNIGMSMAQRPTYAGSAPIGRPGLASRFKDTDAASTEVPIVNRLGEDSTTVKLPVDARGDGGLVNRLNQWPREHRPFWLLNAEHIETHRHPQENNNGNTVASANVANRNNFIGGEDFPSRSTSFDDFDNVQETRPIRPTPSRSSFLGPLN